MTALENCTHCFIIYEQFLKYISRFIFQNIISSFTSFPRIFLCFLNRFEPDNRHLRQVSVRVIRDNGFPAVEFYNSTKRDEDHLLCCLYFTTPSPPKRDSKVRLIRQSYAAFLFARSKSLHGSNGFLLVAVIDQESWVIRTAAQF